MLAACDGNQSAMSPGGPESSAVSIIGWTMFTGAAVILIAVLALLAFGARGNERVRRTIASQRTIVVAGVVLPAMVLTVLLVFGLLLQREAVSDDGDAIVVRVTGEQWWWHVEYLDESGDQIAVTANEIHVPVGQPVRFELVSADVIHSFWVPALGGKLDMIPGRINATTLEADRPGIYRGQCAEFCGAQHALMAVMVVAESPTEFEAWLAQQQEPASEPTGDLAIEGAEVFRAEGCGACHTVRGVAAAGTIGPDLTHVGGRLTLAAGTLPNNIGTLAGWIADTQTIKPGSRMPPFDDLTGTELRALATYLGGLE